MKRKIDIKKILFNKFTIATLVFAAVIIFIDRDNMIKLLKMNRNLKEMKAEEKAYNEEYCQDSIMFEQLKNDSDYRERYAREKYFMKHANEDVYIISADEEE